jgi:outer membrane biosynthesis protein TonB
MTLPSRSLRRAAPWIVSLLAHALLVLLVPLGRDIRGMRAPVVERRVVLELGDAERPRVDPAASSPPAPAIARSDLPLPASLPLPTAPSLDPVDDEVRAASARIVAVTSGVPTTAEVLDTLPPVTTSTSAAVRADAAAAEPTLRVEWSGKPRPWIRKPELRYPSILSSTGLEADGAARVTVSPLGAVIDVEITRSTGYTEIDHDVAMALGSSFVARIEGKLNQTFMVYFSFPQRRPD